MKRPFPVFIFFLVIAAGLACRTDIRAPAVRLTVAAPDYLAGILDSAAQQFEKENRIAVMILYMKPDNIIPQARANHNIDAFLTTDPKMFETLRNDTLMLDEKYDRAFWLSLVLVGRVDGPRTDRIERLAGDDFRRVVIVDSIAAYDGRLTAGVLDKHRLWKRLQAKLITAKSLDHLFSFLETREADATVLLESSLRGRKDLVVMQRFDDEAGTRLLLCGAVTVHSQHKESAQAFLDLFHSRLCDIYKIPGIYLDYGP